MHIFLSIDPALGRLDFESLSDQALMEIVFDGLVPETKKYFQDENGEFLDVCEWDGIICNEDGDVETIAYESMEMNGSVSFEHLPKNVTQLIITHNGYGMDAITGTLETRLLPRKLTEFDVNGNALTGTVDLSQLPSTMVIFGLSINSFEGPLDFTALPTDLRQLFLNNNRFSGNVILTKLPASLTQLYLQINDLSGDIVLENIPATMCKIDLSFNSFGPVLSFRGETGPDFRFEATHNELAGKAIIPRAQLGSRINLGSNAIEAIFDENGKRHPDEDMMT